MVKIWGGYGKGAVSKKEKVAAAAAVKTVRANPGGIVTRAPKQQNIIDFETLLSWYNEHNASEPVAVGDEVSEAHIAAQKQANLKFMLL